MNIILLGAPGAGKGTQAELLCKELQIPTISTGNMLREAMSNGSELGKQVKQYMESGSLVPDDVILSIVAERVAQPDCANGFILDGVPRTLVQAEALDAKGVRIDRVVSLEVDDQKIVGRMSGRRVCTACGATYHIDYKKPAVEGVCNKCGDTLVQRKDDHPDTVKERLSVYHEQTEPLKSYSEKAGKLKIVYGQEEVSDTSALVLKAVEE